MAYSVHYVVAWHITPNKRRTVWGSQHAMTVRVSGAVSMSPKECMLLGLGDQDTKASIIWTAVDQTTSQSRVQQARQSQTLRQSKT